MNRTSKGFGFLSSLPAILVAGLIASSGTAHATVLNNIGAGNVAGVSGYYTSPGNAQYTAGDEGYTPNVSGSWSGFLDPWWIGMFFGSNTTFTLTADPGYMVTLMDFQDLRYSANPRPGYTVLDHNGNVMATIAQGVSNKGDLMSGFGWPTLTDTQLTIVFATDETDGAGIGNIKFSQQAPSPASILTFGLPGNPAAIDQINKTITLYVPNGSGVTSLAPTYTLSTGTCDYDSGTTTYNFTDPVTYTVTDGEIVNHYVVTISEAAIETNLVWKAGDGQWDSSAVNWVGQLHGQPQIFADGVNTLFNKTAGGTITIAPDMAPLTTTVSATTGTYIFTGSPITSGSLTKSGGGTLQLNVTPANFSSTTVNGGTLLLKAEDGFGVDPVTMTNVTINAGSLLQSFHANVTGNLTMNGGTYIESSGWSGSWSGTIDLAANSNFSSIGYGHLNLYATISGPGGLTWSSPHGEGVTLTGSNSYEGPTVVSSGTLECQDSASLGNGGALTIASGGAKVELNYTGTHVVSALTIAGVLKPAGVYGSSLSSAPVWNQDNAHFAGTGTVTAQGTPPVLATFTAVPNPGVAPLEVVFTDTSSSGYGSITNWSWNFGNGTTSTTQGPHSVTYALWGTYPITLSVTDATERSATNFPTSITVTQPANLVVSSTGQYQTATVNVDSSHAVTFNAGINNPVFGGLTGSGSLALADAVGAAVTLDVGSNALANSTFAGVLTGVGGLTKVGTNTFTLSGHNTYLGDTVVSGGTLKLEAGIPGLYEGLVANGTNSWDTDTPITHDSVQLSARMADTYQNWSETTTWGYTGYFFNPASTSVEFTFGKDFDDNGLIKIDGTELFNNTSWDTFVTAKHTLSPGWHALELRVGQGTGGVGPNGNMKDNGEAIGLGWSTDGGITWHGFTDPGDGTVLAAVLGGTDILPTGTTLRINSPGILDIAATDTVSKLYLDGIGQVAGTWGSSTSTANNKNDTYFSGSGVLTVTSSVGGGTTYGTWASTHGLTGTAGSSTDPAFDADPNKDGVANGLVWLIGGTTGNPLANSNSILPVPTDDGGKLVLIFKCLKSGARGSANLYVQYSKDLGAGDAWHGVSVPDSDQADGGSGVGFVVAPIAGSDYNHVTATIASPAFGGKLFGRLMATGN